MTYLQKLLKALEIEGYSKEELEKNDKNFLEKLIEQTMGWERFNLMSSSWDLFDCI